MMASFKKALCLTVLVFYSFFLLLLDIHAQENVGKTTKRLYLPVSGNVRLVKEGDVEKLFLNNYLSSNVLEIDEDGKINSHTYSPYGTTLDLARVLRNDERELDKQFTSHRKLENLSIYHAGARFYSPTVGQFIQPDKKEGPNRYAYVNNNPVEFVDMDGKSATSVIVGRIKEWLGLKLGSYFSHELVNSDDRITSFDRLRDKVTIARTIYIPDMKDAVNHRYKIAKGKLTGEITVYRGIRSLKHVDSQLAGFLRNNPIEDPTRRYYYFGPIDEAERLGIPNAQSYRDLFNRGASIEDIEAHMLAQSGMDSSLYLSTSTSRRKARVFAGTDGYLIEAVVPASLTIDVERGYRRIESMKHPMSVQERILRFLLPDCGECELGVKFGILKQDIKKVYGPK